MPYLNSRLYLINVMTLCFYDYFYLNLNLFLGIDDVNRNVIARHGKGDDLTLAHLDKQ